MKKHYEKRFVDHSPEQMFNLVSNVKSYPDFLPWCLGSRIISNDDNTLIADLIVGFQIYREKFRSKVILNKNKNIIQVYYEDGPFKHLSNKWVFINHKSGCEINFYLEFEFKNIIFQTLIEKLFSEAVKKMVEAFEKRAEKIYKKYK